MKFLGRLVLTITFVWFLISIYAVFWPSVTAQINNKENFVLRQNGYNGVSKPGVSNFKGSNTNVSVISYTYVVSGVSYAGTGRFDVGNRTSLKVYYCPLYPWFSLTSNSIPLPWLLLMGLVGYCLLEINKWLHNLHNKRWHTGGN